MNGGVWNPIDFLIDTAYDDGIHGDPGAGRDTIVGIQLAVVLFSPSNTVLNSHHVSTFGGGAVLDHMKLLLILPVFALLAQTAVVARGTEEIHGSPGRERGDIGEGQRSFDSVLIQDSFVFIRTRRYLLVSGGQSSIPLMESKPPIDGIQYSH